MESSQNQLNLIKQQLDQMIRISKNIVTEIGKDEPSTKRLNKAFNLRQHHINEMEQLIDAEQDPFTDEEKKELKSLFNKFDQLSKRIRDGLEEKLDQYQDKIADATKRRKAEDGYQILKKPDISYF